MALIVERDDYGLYAVVECDRAGCGSHVAVRPVDGSPGGAHELVCEAFDSAQGDGWWLEWQAWCPDHRPRRAGARGTLADALSTVRVVKGPRLASSGRQRPS